MKAINILLEITIYSSILFCAIMLLKLCFKNRMSPFLHLAIWGLLIARLLIPATLESTVHLVVIPTGISDEIAQQAQVPTIGIDPVQRNNVSGANQARQQTSVGRQMINAVVPSAEMQTIVTAQKQTIYSLEKILLAIWLTGVGVGLLYLTMLYIVLRKRIRANTQLPSNRLLELFDEVKGELNIQRDVRIIGQWEYGTPAVLFPNTVLMPINTLVSMSDDEGKYVLRHELMHFKRGDHVLSLLLSVLNAIYWFNPMVWIAFRQIRLDMEIACDSDVVRNFSTDEKSTYAAIILSLFSKKKYGNLVLGMAQGNVKQEAARRIKGVFMQQKTSKHVRATVILLTMVMLFTCFTTACQPTPEGTIVQRKGDLKKSITSELAAPAGTILDFGTPEKYRDDFQSTSGKLAIHVDALVEVPKTNGLPVLKITPRDFTQQDADAMVEALFQGKPLMSNRKDRSMTKQELQDTIISVGALVARLQSYNPATEEGQKVLMEVGLDPETVTDADIQGVIQSLQTEIDSYKEQYRDAPETADTSEPFTILSDLDWGGGTARGIELAGDLGHAHSATLSMYIRNDRSRAKFFNGSASHYMPVMLNPQLVQNSLKISLEDARSLADDFVTAVYPNGDLALSYYALVSQDDNDISSNIEHTVDIDAAPKAYIFEYLRSVNGMPATYTSADCASLKSMEDTTTNPLAYESIEVLVDDSGIVEVNWNSPMQVEETLTQNVEILPFEQVQDIFRRMIAMQYSYVDEVNENYTVDSADVYITRVTLGYTRIASKDAPDEYMLVPVWDFFGYFTQDIQGEPYANERPTAIADVDSLLTINAIDGSIIDRGFGY